MPPSPATSLRALDGFTRTPPAIPSHAAVTATARRHSITPSPMAALGDAQEARCALRQVAQAPQRKHTPPRRARRRHILARRVSATDMPLMPCHFPESHFASKRWFGRAVAHEYDATTFCHGTIRPAVATMRLRVSRCVVHSRANRLLRACARRALSLRASSSTTNRASYHYYISRF